MLHGCVLNSPNIPLQFICINLYFQNFYLQVNPYYSPPLLKGTSAERCYMGLTFLLLLLLLLLLVLLLLLLLLLLILSEMLI